MAEGILEAYPGIGTVVAKLPPSTAADRSYLLQRELEQLIVEAKRLGLTFDDVASAIAKHWKVLEGSRK
jgi:GntR family transcriptional regulator